MKFFSDLIRSGVSTTVSYFNQPSKKEEVKNITSTITFILGATMTVYDLYQNFEERDISPLNSMNDEKWSNAAYTVTLTCSRLSLLMSTAVSRPGVFLISKVVHSLFSEAQLQEIFGPNTIFAVNPWHPRHVVSIAAVMLAIPPMTSLSWFSMDHAKTQLALLFNTLTSRFTLHIENQIAQSILRYRAKPLNIDKTHLFT